ncbi:hypothetical protein DQ356_06260 [Chryseobacterium lacus]|uniref:Uncharacterized protein n=1 Tax=Chryseobacterium lacus TaxID=2058346 RepID=A0A368MYU7_9FLAO|nr:hypothetical protein DQ356_06260 [Chryseobacterium lacus]
MISIKIILTLNLIFFTVENLEKLAEFQLKNEEQLKIVGGNRNTTGGGSYVEYNWPTQGVNTFVTY